MQNIFLFAFVISVVYLFVKFFEMRLIEKENKPVKKLVWETLLVFISSMAGVFIYEQILPIGEQLIQTHPAVFTGEPDF
jgi:TctA family transporter